MTPPSAPTARHLDPAHGATDRTHPEPLHASVDWLNAQGCRSATWEDITHIRRHLPAGTVARNRILRAYVATWLEAAEAEPLRHRRDNAGRRAANDAIREGKL